MTTEFRKFGTRVVCVIALICLWSVALTRGDLRQPRELKQQRVRVVDFFVPTEEIELKEQDELIREFAPATTPIFVVVAYSKLTENFSKDIGSLLQANGFQLGCSLDSKYRDSFPKKAKVPAKFILWCGIHRIRKNTIVCTPQLIDPNDVGRGATAPFIIRGFRHGDKWKWKLLPQGTDNLS